MCDENTEYSNTFTNYGFPSERDIIRELIVRGLIIHIDQHARFFVDNVGQNVCNYNYEAWIFRCDRTNCT